MHHNEVHVAFEILIKEIEAVANELNVMGAEAFRAGDYEKAKVAIEEATRLAEFSVKVKALQKEWAQFKSLRPRVRKSKGRKSKGHLPRGLRTPDDAFRSPILEALVELGGSAAIGDVLDRVEQKMKGVLNQYDYQSLPSNPSSIRWRNTAQWCRNTLVREGLMKGDSSHGVWEISDQGRKWLKEHHK